jgi:integrase
MACVKRRRNRWVVDFRDQDGKRRWQTYDTRDEADTALSKLVPAVRQGTYRAPAELPTLEAVARDWFASKGGHRVSSQAGWQVHLDRHILPALGKRRIDQITVADVDAFRDDRRAAGLAPQTVNKLLTTLAALFVFAQRRELVTRNPAAVAERCRLNADELAMEALLDADDSTESVNPDDVLSPEEAGRLIAAAPEGFDKTFLLTTVLTGGRVGELTALTWDDMNFQTGRLSIRRSVSWAKLRGQTDSKPRFYEPKTKAGKRTIDVAPELTHALKVWKLACPPSPLNLLFSTEEGTPKHRSTITHHTLRPTLKAAGLHQVTLHSLRHTCASALILAGTDCLEVAKFLGHAKPTVTMAVYAHWFNMRKTASTMATVAQTVFHPSFATPEAASDKGLRDGMAR